MIKFFNINRFIMLAAVALALVVTSCGEKALLYEMSTNRIDVVLKGTYESGDSWGWQLQPTGPLGPNDASVEHEKNVIYKGGTYATIGTNDALPTQMMLDIAEIRILDTEGNEWKFANFRQTYTINLTDGDPFFTTGITLQTEDVFPDKTYTTLRLYVRKIIFNNASEYKSTDGGATWTFVSNPTATFAESTVNGYDITSSMMNTYWDSLRVEAAYINRIYPVDIPISGGFQFDPSNSKTVIEARLLVKNFVKKYEYKYYPSGEFHIIHFWGLSDHLRRIHENESYTGGNLLSVARSYVVGGTRTLTVQGVTTAGYLLLVPAGSTSNYVIADPLPDPDTTDLRVDKVPNCDLPKPPVNPGNYISPLMDYYLNYEKYKITYTSKLNTCYAQPLGTAQYQAEWDAYYNAVTSFSVPPIAIYAVVGDNKIYNIKPGVYDVYKASGAPSYGRIFNQTINKISGGSAGTVDLTGGDQSVAY